MQAARKTIEAPYSSINEVPYDDNVRPADFHTLLSLLPKEEQCCEMATD